MRILLITSKPFLPQKDGGNVASGKLFSELSSAAVQITYCTLFSEKHPFVTEVFEKLRMNEVLAFPIRLKTYIFNAATTLLQGKSYVLKRFENKAFEKYLIENQKNFDLIIFDSLFSTLPLLNPKFTHSKIWLRSHNIEHQLWLDRKKKTKNPILKLYFGFEADRLKKHLNTIHSKLQGILGITENETAVYNMINPKIAFNYPISATPGKVDLDPKPIFFHFGAMNWFPNIESAKIFVQDFVPQILVKCPKAKFKMAGAFFDTFQDKIPIDIEKIGFVENSKEFISTAGILVAPIQSGSGVRIKILEALELGTLVLTTTKGAEGISTLKFPNLFIEDNWQKFIDMAVKLASEPSLRIEINLKIESLLNNSWNDPKLLEILTNEGR